MAGLIYALCAVTAMGCFGLLWRGYRRSRARLLFWAALCFAGLTASNLVLVADLAFMPGADLSLWRLGLSALANVALLYGLIFEVK